MKSSHLLIMVFLLVCFEQSFAAKIYKCKDANGKTVFSNFACDAENLNRGMIGTNAIGSSNEAPVYKIQVDDGLSPAERQLKNLQDQKKNKLIMREMQRESARKRAQHEREMEAERERQKRAAQVNKANCEYYKSKADYWGHESRDRDDTKSDNLIDKTFQKRYERKMASEC